MPKKYSLKSTMELLRIKELQDAEGQAPVDWAQEARVEELRKFFCDASGDLHRRQSGEGENNATGMPGVRPGEGQPQ